MKKNKLAFLPLLATSLITLSGCNYLHSLLNDDDMEIKNSFNPITSTSTTLDPNAVIAGGVEAKENENVQDAYYFKDVGYAKDDKIPNTYKVGGDNENEYNVNGGEDYYGSRSRNNYDLYVPKNLDKNENHTVILFIHGGAWVSGFKTDVNPYVFEFVNRGYITATIKYTLLKRSMDDPTLSIFRNLDEIDACITSIKEVLGELGFDTTKSKLVIGGASSGSHLAMLYSYSRGQRSAIPLQFIVNAVGPVDIKPYSWKGFVNASEEVLDAGLSSSAIATQETNGNLRELEIAGEGASWNDYQTMRIANGMCGLPFSLETVEAATDENKRDIVDTSNEAAVSMTKSNGGEDLLSVTHWMSSTSNYPMIAAYAGKDSIVGIAQYSVLENALNANSITHEYFYFKNCDHTEVSEKNDKVTYDAFVNKINDWCEAL